MQYRFARTTATRARRRSTASPSTKRIDARSGGRYTRPGPSLARGSRAAFNSREVTRSASRLPGNSEPAFVPPHGAAFMVRTPFACVVLVLIAAGPGRADPPPAGRVGAGLESLFPVRLAQPEKTVSPTPPAGYHHPEIRIAGADASAPAIAIPTHTPEGTTMTRSGPLVFVQVVLAAAAAGPARAEPGEDMRLLLAEIKKIDLKLDATGERLERKTGELAKDLRRELDEKVKALDDRIDKASDERAGQEPRPARPHPQARRQARRGRRVGDAAAGHEFVVRARPRPRQPAARQRVPQVDGGPHQRQRPPVARRRNASTSRSSPARTPTRSRGPRT